MGKFVQDYILSVRNIAGAAHHRVPGQHNGSMVPRFTQALTIALGNYPAVGYLGLFREVCTGINQDGLEFGITISLSMQQKHARLARDRDLDIVVQLKAGAPLKLFFSQELLNVCFQFPLVSLNEPIKKRQPFLKNLSPDLRK